MKNFNWNATAFFEQLTAANRLAQSEGFTFCRVSGLEGFEQAVNQMQSANNFVCVSDLADGYTELNNSPRTRRIKTVFFAIRHGVDDMDARAECMETMRELFRQFMSRLILEKVRLEQNCIYIDPRISFNEIDRYFFSGCAGAYFQIAVDVYTDLRYNGYEWTDGYIDNEYQYNIPGSYDMYLSYFAPENKILAMKEVKDLLGLSLKGAKDIVDSTLPVLIQENLNIDSVNSYKEKINSLDIQYSTFTFIPHGQKP